MESRSTRPRMPHAFISSSQLHQVFMEGKENLQASDILTQSNQDLAGQGNEPRTSVYVVSYACLLIPTG